MEAKILTSGRRSGRKNLTARDFDTSRMIRTPAGGICTPPGDFDT